MNWIQVESLLCHFGQLEESKTDLYFYKNVVYYCHGEMTDDKFMALFSRESLDMKIKHICGIKVAHQVRSDTLNDRNRV